jgi:hypothetical protein
MVQPLPIGGIVKRLTGFALGLSLFAALGFAETYSGTLTDVMCKDKDLTSHTRQCALGCAKSGFGLVTSDGKFLKFDEAGNAKAVAALKASDKESDLKAQVNGKLEGQVLRVESVQLQ